jgi:hypothetical protein
MSAAWRAAAADLDIRVEAPYVVGDENGEAIGCVAFVADFGSTRGMLVASLSAPSDTGARCLEFSGALLIYQSSTGGKYSATSSS